MGRCQRLTLTERSEATARLGLLTPPSAITPPPPHLNGEEFESPDRRRPACRLWRSLLLRLGRLHELLAGVAARPRHHRPGDRHAVHDAPDGERRVGARHGPAGPSPR